MFFGEFVVVCFVEKGYFKVLRLVRSARGAFLKGIVNIFYILIKFIGEKIP